MRLLLGTLAGLFGWYFFLGQKPNSPPACDATVVKFVAPPYPRAAKDNRMMGTVVSEISVARDGSVTIESMRAHPVFEQPVRNALAQWRFMPANQGNKLQVTIRFELDLDTCEGTDRHPLTAETRVSAELPSSVRVTTGVKCVELESSTSKKNR
jgi:TonB family protein